MATPATQRVYEYDESDNRTFMDDHVNTLTYRYVYDEADQLEELQVISDPGDFESRDPGDFEVYEEFVFDDDANMTERTLDPNGTPETTVYSWDAFDKLTAITIDSATPVVNKYDAGGVRKLRVSDTNNKLKSFHSGLPTVSEEDTDGNTFSWFMGHMLMGFEKNGARFYAIHDGLGSIRILTSSSGVEAASYENDEFGIRIASSESSGTSPKTFAGGFGVTDESSATGLHLMSQRWMDPKLGRFLSRDPLGYAAGPNLFVYAMNNPTAYVDPTGLKLELGSNLSADQSAQVKGWLDTVRGSDSSAAQALRALEADPRTVTIKAGDLNGIPGYTPAEIQIRRGRDGSLYGHADSVEVILDFDEINSKKVQDQCDGRPEIILGHELGHAYHALFAGLHSALVTKMKDAGVRIDGISIDEVLIRETFEDPLRESLGLPAKLQQSTVTKASDFMRNNTRGHGLHPNVNWRF